MAEIRDIVRVTNAKPSSSDLPDVDTTEGLRESAHLVYQLLLTKLNNKSVLLRHDGVPGKKWQGKILLDVFYFIWPHMDDRMYVTKVRSDEMFTAIVGYLRECKMLQCKEKGSNNNAAVWWIADHWTPMEPISAATAQAQDDAMEDPQEDGSGHATCRSCPLTFENTARRGAHEFRAHNIAVSGSGEVISYDGFTDRDADEILLVVIGEAGDPVVLRRIQLAAHDMDPRMGAVACKTALARLVERGDVQQLTVGSRLMYSLSAQATTRAVPVEVTASVEDTELVKAQGVPMAHANLTALLDTTQKGLLAAAATLTQTARVMDTVQEYCRELESSLSKAEQAIVSLRMQLMAKSTRSPVELDALREQIEQLAKERDTFMGERDGYRDKLEAWQSALTGLGLGGK